MNECIKRYRKGITEKMKNTNTKEYWKNLNSIYKDKICAIDINDYLNCIKGITLTEDESLALENYDYFLNVAHENVDDFPICEIDDGKILAAVQNLKKQLSMQHVITEC